jgi:hypothetical protein
LSNLFKKKFQKNNKNSKVSQAQAKTNEEVVKQQQTNSLSRQEN